MLNIAFSKETLTFDDTAYVLPQELICQVKLCNKQTSSGPEMRLQNVFSFEVWNSLQRLGLYKLNWNFDDVLDICSGTGYLSYHLLKHSCPQSITLLDISFDEINQARLLIQKHIGKEIKSNYIVSDALDVGFVKEKFDLIMGNSFLHHFYNLPQAIQRISTLLKPGGVFISLHEPTPSALPLESGRIGLWLKYILKGQQVLEGQRYPGPKLIAEGGGADVWMICPEDLYTMLVNAGFSNIEFRKQRIIRSLVVSILNLHLNAGKINLTRNEETLLRIAIQFDDFLSKLLPRNWFGSFAVVAQKHDSIV